MTERESWRRQQRRRRKRRLWAILLVVLVIAAVVVGKVVKNPQDTKAAEEEASVAVAVVTPTPEPTPTMEPLPELDTDEWYLRLVSLANPLDADYAPPALTEIERGETMDSRVAVYMQALIAAARAAGYDVYVCSGYRDYDTQSWIYWNHVETYEAEGMTREEAEAKTLLEVNYPGASEHQYGLTADILEYENQDMEPYIGGSGLMLWLEEHCADYGFVVRYPEGKTDITGVEYEPWHLRFVGGEAASYMMRNNLCLEEFLALYEETDQ